MKLNQNYKDHIQTALVAAVSSVAIMAAGPAVAQDDDNSSDDTMFEEIVVVGKFQQSLVDRIQVAPHELPFSLDVLDRGLLDLRNYARPIEALTTLPNVRIVTDNQNTGTPRFFARGFESPVLVDNRAQNAFRGSGGRDDSFVERYEVLRGPASITLGPVGSGGVFNTITKLPQEDPFVGTKIRADHFGSIATELDVNFGAILGSDVVSGRISGAYRNFEYDARFSDRKTVAIRPVIVMDFSEKTAARVSMSYTGHQITANRGFPLLSDGTVPENWDTGTFLGWANGRGDVEDIYYEGELTHDFLDNLKLTLRGSRQTTDFDYKDSSATYNYNYANGEPGINIADPYVYLYSYARQTESESTFLEGQLAADFDWGGNRQDFVIAVNYSTDAFNRDTVDGPDVATIPAGDVDVPRVSTESFGAYHPTNIFDGELFSILAEAAIRPTDWLTIVAGIRYDDLKQDSVRYRRGIALESGNDEQKFTYRAGASAAVSDALNIYASFAQSFTPQSGNTLEGNALDPELSEGYEFGVKGALLGDKLNFTAALFRTTRNNLALSRATTIDGELFFYSETIGSVRAQGFEWTSTFNPVESVSINFNYGFTDTDILQAGDFDEVTSTAFPRHSFSGYISYTVPSGALEGLRLGGGARYTGERPSVVEGVSFDSYTLADINISYPIRENLEIALDVLNVTDELYLESAGGFNGRLTGGSLFGDPRTAVVTLRGRF